MQEEIRKVLPRSGSLQVTIPRRWCREMGLVRGSFVVAIFDRETTTVTLKALRSTENATEAPLHPARRR